MKKKNYLNDEAKKRYHATMESLQAELDELPESEFMSELDYIQAVRAGEIKPKYIEDGDQVVDVSDWDSEDNFQTFYADELAFILQNKKDIQEANENIFSQN